MKCVQSSKSDTVLEFDKLEVAALALYEALEVIVSSTVAAQILEKQVLTESQKQAFEQGRVAMARARGEV